MRRFFKWAGIGLGVLVGLLVLAFGAAFVVTELKLNRTITGVGEPVTVSADPALALEGKRLVVARGCVDCHAQDLGGTVFIDDPALGRVVASNLTRGKGGVGAQYDDALFERAIRHGVGYDGKPLLIMPSHEYYLMNDEDVGAIIAYLRGAPSVDRELPANGLGPLGRVLGAVGAIELTPVNLIDETAGRDTPPLGETVEYGRYLATVNCTGCHTQSFAGGPNPAPGGAPVANITPDTATGIGDWSEADFVRAMREGVRPDSSALNLAMPWPSLGKMTDTELKALYKFLRTLPPLPEGGK